MNERRRVCWWGSDCRRGEERSATRGEHNEGVTGRALATAGARGVSTAPLVAARRGVPRSYYLCQRARTSSVSGPPAALQLKRLPLFLPLGLQREGQLVAPAAAAVAAAAPLLLLFCSLDRRDGAGKSACAPAASCSGKRSPSCMGACTFVGAAADQQEAAARTMAAAAEPSSLVYSSNERTAVPFVEVQQDS